MSSILGMLIVAVLAGPGQLDSAKQSISDSATTARIETTYLFNEHLSPFNINTTTRNGVVTLSGGVRTQIQKDLAGELAASFDGVTQVDNRITVVPNVESSIPKRNFRRKFADKSISASVRTRLLYRKNLRRLKINAKTINSVVTLTGLVDTQFQKEEVGYVAFQTKGVEQVINRLTIRGIGTGGDTEEVQRKFSDEFIEKRVEKSILLNRHLSIRHVDVEVDGGICYLTGTVQTDPERRLAESIAINTSGVTEVRNTIYVRSDVAGEDGYLDVLEVIETPDLEPLDAGIVPRPASGDTPLFSEGARID